MAFYSIGHSTRSIEDFIELLKLNKISRLADVRSAPSSKAQPQYNQEALKKSLATAGIEYKWFPKLGGHRPRQKDVEPEVNAGWDNQSFHNYADYAMGNEFNSGFNELLSYDKTGNTAYMCAEAQWRRCHRRIITDYLIMHKESVFHIISKTKTDKAEVNEGAKMNVAKGIITYPKKG